MKQKTKTWYYPLVMMGILCVLISLSSQKANAQQQQEVQTQSTADKILADTLFFPPEIVVIMKMSINTSPPHIMFSFSKLFQPSIEAIIQKYGKADMQTEVSRKKLFDFYKAEPVPAAEGVETFLFYKYDAYTFIVPANKSERKVIYIRWENPRKKS